MENLERKKITYIGERQKMPLPQTPLVSLTNEKVKSKKQLEIDSSKGEISGKTRLTQYLKTTDFNM